MELMRQMSEMSTKELAGYLSRLALDEDTALPVGIVELTGTEVMEIVRRLMVAR